MASRKPFRVVALLAAHNEADIIGQVVADLVQQGIDVYLIDDASSDGTVAAVEPYLHHGLIAIESRPPNEVFQWSEILRRKEELAVELEADWFLHQDADEFRESPWPGLGLCEAMRVVDDLGYNAIDFKVLNFRPTDDQSRADGDIRQALRFYEPAAPWDELQIKGWKKSDHRPDLVSSGGHDAIFPRRMVCPIQFLSRHYPLRTQEQAERKIFHDLRPRLASAERHLGWHVQYDEFPPGHRFAWDRARLREFDSEAVKRALALTQRDHPALGGTTEREAEKIQTLLGGVRACFASEVESIAGRYEVEVGRIRAELQALRDSRSWRLTAPLRAIGRQFERPVKAAPVEASRPAAAEAAPISWGDLERVSPVSANWGLDRGTPVDRHYIEAFLRACQSDIRGVVLEVKDSGYTRLYGGDRVRRAEVLDLDASNAQATVVADLAQADAVPSDQFDCFILTQTLHIIYDIAAGLRHARRILKPGGSLLCTIPAVSRVNDEDGGLVSGDYWRLTHAAVRRLFAEAFSSERDEVSISTFGNVRSCTAFLYGFAAEELPPSVLECHDPWFPLVHCIRAIKQP